MRKTDARAAKDEASDTKQASLKSLAWLMKYALSESVRLAAHREYLVRTWGQPDEPLPSPPVTYYVAHTREEFAEIERRLAETGEEATIVRDCWDEEEARKLGFPDPSWKD